MAFVCGLRMAVHDDDEIKAVTCGNNSEYINHESTK
jgi:hypothetical protein